jgi:hypothetical protein
VFGVRPRSENTRHECFVMDASVLVQTTETAEMDDARQLRLTPVRRLLARRDAAVSGSSGVCARVRPDQASGGEAKSKRTLAKLCPEVSRQAAQREG